MAGAWRGSLRARLMVGVVLLAAVGMVAVNAVSLLGLRLNLVDAADTTLTKTRDSVQHQVHRPKAPINLDNLNSLIPDGAYIAMVDDRGRVVAQTPTRTADGQARSRPDLPTPLPDDFAGHIVTVSSQDAPLPRYRTLSFPLGYSATVQRPGQPPQQFSRVVIAKSLKPADDAIYWLIGSDSAATLAVLGASCCSAAGCWAWACGHCGTWPPPRPRSPGATSTSGSRSPSGTPRWARSAPPSTGPSTNGSGPRSNYGSSWPTPPMSCAPR
ncbi:hypothetical protein Srufu_032550 [Streptomyces libani subsp. rufus]|nr:hypothetical protein Srufu_032550 [Streptomyces libani subsp. rufus]